MGRRPGSRRTRRRFAWASLFSLTYFGLHQLVDVYVGSPCVLFALALSVGYLDISGKRSIVRSFGRLRLDLRQSRLTRGRRVAAASAIALGLAIVAATGALAWSESNALPADRAVGFANDGNWTAAASTAATAAADDPDFPAYQLILGLADLHTGDPAGAARALARSTAIDDFPQAWLDLAAARTQLGDVAGAREALTHAMRLGYQQPSVAFGAGWLYLQLGDRAAAVNALGAAIAVAPTLAADPWFMTGAGVDLREPALAVALATWNPDAWDNALLAGDPAAALGRLDALPTEALRARARQVIAAVGGDPQARADLAAAARANPNDLVAVGWSARLARSAGDEPTAERYRQWSDIVQPATGVFGLDMRVTTVEERDPAGGVDPGVFGDYTYRRPLPADLLAPTLPHLHLR